MRVAGLTTSYEYCYIRIYSMLMTVVLGVALFKGLISKRISPTLLGSGQNNTPSQRCLVK